MTTAAAKRIDDISAFIHAQTRPHPVPHVPEIQLRVADEAAEIWRKTEEELGEMGLPPPFWAFAWAGGQALARYLLDHAQEIAGHRVLDFASGSGLVAIAAARAGAQAVTACEIDAFACRAIAINSALNGVDIEIRHGDLLDGDCRSFDIILAGDVFYEQPMSDRVLAWLLRAKEQGATVLIGDPGRTYLPRDHLRALAHYAVPVTRTLEDNDIKNSTVWQLTGA